MCRRPEQRGARRASARAVAWRLHHEDPRKIGRLRGYHRLRPDRRRSLRRASLRNPARYRARHSAPRRHLRQRLRQQGQSGRRKSARYRSRHPPQGQRKEQARLLRTHPLQGPRPHRAGRRKAQALQTRSAPMRKDRTKLQINRQLRRRPLLDQIRPHGLAEESAGFTILAQPGSDEAMNKMWDGRTDLGNVESGDGAKFRPRGLLEIVGKANYTNYSEITGIDLVSDPNIAANPQVALLTAAAYWTAHNINEAADRDDVEQ